MPISKAIDNWLITKAAKSKAKELYRLASKTSLFKTINNQEEIIDGLRAENMLLKDRNNILTTKLDNIEKNQRLKKEVATLEKDLEVMKQEQHLNKTDLAYEALKKKYNELHEDYTDLKKTLNTVGSVVEEVKTQNTMLKEKLFRTEKENERLTLENKIKPISHNYTLKGNTNKRMLITRNVNN